MRKFVVITTISEPTESIAKFASLKGWQLIVVGDKKTPKGWKYSDVIYLSVEEQISRWRMGLPFNNYVRKMLGYIYAMERGADIIADSDDDNLPLRSSWGFPETKGKKFDFLSDIGFENIYSYFTSKHIWPRGLPLDEINKNKSRIGEIESPRVGVWQGLVCHDPDVDAINRLVFPDLFCDFQSRYEELILGFGVVCPFNSQNTFWPEKKLFPLLYLPVTVNSRFCDILRGYVAQSIMWMAGYYLGFMPPNAVQYRNPHNLIADFEDEIPCYIYPKKVYNIAMNSVCPLTSIEENLYNVYLMLAQEKIVHTDELVYLRNWLMNF